MSMLRSIREKKGLTLGQLAARASISARTLTEYEEGRQPIPLSHAKVLAKALWVQIEDLMPPAGAVQSQRPASSAPAAPPPTVRQTPAPQMQPPVQDQSQQPQRPYVPPSAPSQAGAANGNQATGQYSPRPAERTGVRSYREDSSSQASPRQGAPASAARRGGEGRPVRPSRPPAAPPKPISEGQTEELLRLGARLGMEQAQVEEQLGKPVSALTRSDAKDWIKKLRETASENGSTGRVHFGHWPGSREDEEAAYLGRQREEGNILRFKLFDGEEFKGTVSEYTPYTITIKTLPGGEDTVLRKLAIVYYRQTGEVHTLESASTEQHAADEQPTGEAAESGQPPVQVPHSHPVEEIGVDSDRTGEPTTPERDNMDEDRGV